MENTYIYSLSDPITDQVKYIGKTNYPKRRYAAHFRKSNKVHLKKEDWVDSLKIVGLKPKFDILDEVPISEWEFWEKHYISLYRSWGFDLFNVTTGGGHDNTGYKHDAATIKIMKERQKAAWTLEKREEARKRATGKKASEKTLKKMREVQSRISTQAKPVLQFDSNMSFLAKFKSVQEASKITREPFAAIYGSTRKHHITQNGFTWRQEDIDNFAIIGIRIGIKKSINKCNRLYKKLTTRYIKYFSPKAEFIKNTNRKIGRKKFSITMKEKFNNAEYKKEHIKHLDISREKQKKAVSQFDLNGNFIKTYESMHEAGRSGGFNFKKISACTLGKEKTHKNFIWKLA